MDFGLREKWIFYLYYYSYGSYNISEIEVESSKNEREANESVWRSEVVIGDSTRGGGVFCHFGF